MKCLFFFMAMALTLGCGSCNPSDEQGGTETPQGPGVNNNNNNGNGGGNGTDPGNNEGMKIKITIGSATFNAELAGNAAASAFAEMLPLTLDMGDVNANEKFARLGRSLPVSASNPGTIRTGDLMLWGSDGLVLFYKTFSTSYSYTPIGVIGNASGLESVVGTGNVTVKFEPLPE